MPGGGKSTVGRHLARRLGVTFVDTDDVIEARIGRPIRSFFETDGEARFRQIESEVLSDLLHEAPGVIATGGGIVLAPGNREALRRATTCVYLRSTPEELLRRVRHDTRRPLLQGGDPLVRLQALFAARDSFYRDAAHLVVDAGRSTAHALVRHVAWDIERVAAGGDPGGS